MAMEGSETLAISFRRQAEQLAEAAKTAREETAQLRAGMQSEIKDLDHLVTDLSALAESVGANFGGQAKALLNAASNARETSVDIRKELAAQADALSQSGRTLKAEIQEIGRAAQARAEALKQTSDKAFDRAEDVGKAIDTRTQNLDRMTEEMATRLDEVSQTIREQATAMAQASEEAAIQARTLEQNQVESKREVFLRSAAVVVEDLNSSAIDISGILDSDVPDELWRSYRRGDRSAFTRWLVRHRDRFTLKEIEERFERDERFRTQANRYIQQFETLLRQANDADPDQVLSQTFMTADVGKLYLLLSRSIGHAQ